MKDKKCFIIMPVSTPPEFVSDYNDDNEHFLNVMEQLFIPAIKEAGFEPILPITKGSDIIHGHIISNLESSDLVLCDMSTKNPNVFFELGIRTALNKPVCLVKDRFLNKVPFDIASINYHVYSPDLSICVVEDEVDKIAKHITASFCKNENCNSLWKYFGTKTQSTEVIAQFEETIAQSKKEQQIRDIENRLEKFYMPADDVINFKHRRRENTINGFKRNTDGQFVPGLQHLRKYSYLADEDTCNAYEKYMSAKCTTEKPITCQDTYEKLNFNECENYTYGCHHNWSTCPHNLEYCEYYPDHGESDNNKDKDKNKCTLNNANCKYITDLKYKIEKDIEDYKNELLKLKK